MIQYLNLVSLERLAKKYLKKYLEIKSRESKIEIHGKCRKRFTDSWTIDSEFIQWKRLRSSFTTFSRKTNCFFCDEVATVDKKLSGRNGAYAVSTLTTKNYLIGHCIERGEIVKVKLEFCISLVAEKAIYHDTCQKGLFLRKRRQRKRLGVQKKLQ